MKKRIIPSILLKNGTNACISQNFSPWRTVGTLTQNLKLHIQREADELLIIDPFKVGEDFVKSKKRIFKLIRKEVDIPISYSGNILSEDDASQCINSGFDKVFLTKLFYESPSCIKNIVNLIGSQSVGICLPYLLHKNGERYLWNYLTRKNTNIKLYKAIEISTDLGVGEIMLFNISLDGSLKGMDYGIDSDLEKSKTKLPIIIAGGLSNELNAYEILSKKNVNAILVGSAFSLTQTTPLTIRNFCLNKGINMRIV